MNWQYSPYLLPLIGTAVLTILAAMVVSPLRRAPGAGTLLALLLVAAAWSLTDFVQYGVQTLEPKLVWSNLVYIWTGLTPVLWIVFCLQYTHLRGRLKPSEFLSLLIIPVVGLILAFVDPTDGLMRRDVTLETTAGVTRIAKTYGPWFWVQAVYLHGLVVVGSALLLRHIARSGRIFGAQGMLLLTGALVPWLANVAYLAGGYDLFRIDPTPLATGASGVLLMLAVRRMSLFDLSPAGRDAAIEAMHDGWLVVDPADRIVDLNPAAQRLLVHGNLAGPSLNSLVGRRLSILAPALSPMLRAQMDPAARDEPVSVGRGSATRRFQVEQSALKDRYGESAGHVLTLRDVTRELAVLSERDTLIQALQQALTEVHQLAGLLPICYECNKILDAEGNWVRMEAYLTSHAGTSFTHGLCPECLQQTLERAGALDSEDADPPADAGCAEISQPQT